MISSVYIVETVFLKKASKMQFLYVTTPRGAVRSWKPNAIKPLLYSFFALMLMSVEVWNCAVVESGECWLRLHSQPLSTRQPCSLTFHGIPLFGWIDVALKYFHFAVIIKLALTVVHYYSTILKFIELFRVTYCFTNICKSSLHSLIFIRLSN